MPHQPYCQRRAHHGSATVTHNRETGCHTTAIREPLDQRRNRRNVAQPLADTTKHTAAEVQQPELVSHHTHTAQNHATTPAERAAMAPALRGPACSMPGTPERCRDPQHGNEYSE